MSLGAFISLEDISEALPPYREEVVSIEMDPPLKEAYKKLEEDVKTALNEHRRNQSVMSVALNALLPYPVVEKSITASSAYSESASVPKSGIGTLLRRQRQA